MLLRQHALYELFSSLSQSLRLSNNWFWGVVIVKYKYTFEYGVIGPPFHQKCYCGNKFWCHYMASVNNPNNCQIIEYAEWLLWNTVFLHMVIITAVFVLLVIYLIVMFMILAGDFMVVKQLNARSGCYELLVSFGWYMGHTTTLSSQMLL